MTPPRDPSVPFDRTRRQALQRLGKVALATSMIGSAGRVWAETTGSRAKLHDVGRKFESNGKIRGFSGNTIICHVPQQEAGYETFDSLLDVYRDLQPMGFAKKLSILPPSSYHMTIFGCANDQDRVAGKWPGIVSLDAPLETCHATLIARLSALKLDSELPFRMRVDAGRTPPPEGLRVELVPVDAAEEAKLRRLRDRIAEAVDIHTTDHDSYTYHLSLGYQTAPFDKDEADAFERSRRGWHQILAKKIDVLHLGAPEFCTFRDMYAFRRRLLIT